MVHPPFFSKPTIRLLVYTDDSSVDFNNEEFGLGTMHAHLMAHKPVFADLDVKRLRRNGTEPNRLTDGLLKDFDEIWFFGFHQVNRRTPGGIFLRGTTGSELEDSEVDALKCWMKVDSNGGGVMVTGDHSEPPPDDAVASQTTKCPPEGNETLLVLGRAIGRCIPRAGQLRRWRGTPSNDENDSFNTQVERPGLDPDLLKLQIDEVPQQLVLPHFNDAGQFDKKGRPHPLFWYTSANFIRVFPDHAHEGAVILPCESQFKDTDTWPNPRGIQPRPQIVAFGLDERECNLRPVLAAYNGDSADVGRIVSDSSFHHYLNINLRNFPSPSPVGSAADQIGQYYGNLAMWLCPRVMRQQMAHAMLGSLASHPLILEEFGNPPLTVGSAAYSLISNVASPCEIHELLQSVMPERILSRFESVYLPERGIPLSAFPSREMILGTMIKEIQGQMRKVEEKLGDQIQVLDLERTLRSAVNEGFNAAFSTQTAILKQFASAAEALN